MLKIFTGLLLGLLLAVPAAAQWEMSEFMIFMGLPHLGHVGWPNWPKDELSPEQSEALAKAMAQADFNSTMWPVDKLELCRKYGLKLMVEGASPEMASRLSGDPTVWGYYITDEPWGTDKFPAFADTIKAFHQADPNHPAYINLLSRAGDYLSSFINTVQPEILSYDLYQWWYGRFYEYYYGCESHFLKLEQHRDAALAAGIPLICWIEVTAEPSEAHYLHVPPPPDNEQKLRQSVFTSLAYGVKGIQWFTSCLMFKIGTSELNQCGRDVAAINAELKRLGPILINLHSVDVFHTPPLPRNTRDASPDHWVQAVGEELVLGIFKDDKKKDFLIVTNRNYRHERKVVLQFQRFERPIEVVEKFDKKTGEWIELQIHKREKDWSDLYNRKRLNSFLGYDLTTFDDERIFRMMPAALSYPPPHDVVEFIIAPGDGELLRVK